MTKLTQKVTLGLFWLAILIIAQVCLWISQLCRGTRQIVCAHQAALVDCPGDGSVMFTCLDCKASWPYWVRRAGVS